MALLESAAPFNKSNVLLEINITHRPFLVSALPPPLPSHFLHNPHTLVPSIPRASTFEIRLPLPLFFLRSPFQLLRPQAFAVVVSITNNAEPLVLLALCSFPRSNSLRDRMKRAIGSDIEGTAEKINLFPAPSKQISPACFQSVGTLPRCRVPGCGGA
ncbi:hypothetical protein RRG08_000642 [Elysia crispata]|uniref:Uncharacterized protein n=1 Tax=Elysia crispata TaxID=231223 RepID=A0AAE1CUF0_9GAST|nr:hypothetical protein RRG08_000642 [Elysia crispata]